MDSTTSWIDANNRLVRVGDTTFAYRELGRPGGTPLVLLNHWGAVLDNFDPRIVDGLEMLARWLHPSLFDELSP